MSYFSSLLPAHFEHGFTDAASTGPIVLSEQILNLHPFFISPDKMIFNWQKLEDLPQALMYQIAGLSQISSLDRFYLDQTSNRTEVFIAKDQSADFVTFSLQAMFLSSNLMIDGNLVQFSRFSDLVDLKVSRANRLSNLISVGQGTKV